MKADIASMDEIDLQLLAQNPHSRKLLEAYLIAATESPFAQSPAAASADGHLEVVQESGPKWAARISQIGNLSGEALSKVHGQLIALGWLHFQFDDTLIELTYRVSPDGRRMLKKVAEMDLAAESQTQEAMAA